MSYDPSLDKAPELLARAARAAGLRPDLTQGGGGNVSIKLNSERMLVKASGVKLKDVSAAGGYALVNYGNIRRRIAAGPGTEGEFSDFICAQTLPVRGVAPAKPSIETGFHALLNTVVIHTHSVYANILNMSAEGHRLGRELFPAAEFIGYRSPGPQLCSAVNERARASGPQVFFLANHGLAAAHAGVEGALELNASVNETIRRGLRLPAYPAAAPSPGLSPHNAERLAVYGKTFLLENVLSPDQALYCGPAELEGKGGMEAANEVLTALFYILDCMRLLKLTPRFLTKAETAYFDTMKSGRYSRKG
ncbi:MAG TPA: class II aldolase/adducin family protein [Elusimicrobiales bacterium]|nr:class II aldolase/adducin family protein [Elusimicrobiales bacterium]